MNRDRDVEWVLAGLYCDVHCIDVRCSLIEGPMDLWAIKGLIMALRRLEIL